MANQYQEWTNENIEFLKGNYTKMTDEEIGIALGRSTSGVNTKRKRLKLKRDKPLLKQKNKTDRKVYTEEESKEQLIQLFNKLKRPPTIKEGSLYEMKPARCWYVKRYGSIENACAHYGLMEKPLSVEERMDISIVELRNMSEQLARIPFRDEYEQMRINGYSMFPLKKYFNMTYSQICDKYLIDFKEIIPDGYKKCSACGALKLTSDFGIDSCAKSGFTSNCKICDYFKRNKLIVPNGWTEEECLIVIDNILNEKVKHVNDLCEILHRELEDIIYLIKDDIPMGNKPVNVKYNCSYCGKEDHKTLSVYLKNKEYFCSSDCYWKYKKEFEPRGEDHYTYNRIEKKCDNCGTDIKVIPWGLENYSHNFCSQKCYWEFRGKYYIGENHPQYGVERTPEQKRKMRIVTTNLYTNGTFERKTKPQIKVDEMLTELNIKYENEYNCKYYSIDNYLTDYNLMIEINGDYFHSNPLRFSELNQMQVKGIVRDKRKRTYIKRYKDIDVLYLWETDINKHPELCRELILEYVNNKGAIDNYNSFNYSLIDGKLVLNEDLVTPYVDWDIKHINAIKKEIV